MSPRAPAPQAAPALPQQHGAPLHIAYGIHNRDGYFIHGLASMHSLMKGASVPLVAHILHDGTLGAPEEDAFQKVASRSGGEAVFHDIAKESAGFPQIPALERFSKGCLFRLLLPQLLPNETVLYLDSDIIATGDALPLFADALARKDGPPLWAVRDSAPAHRPGFRAYIRSVFGEYDGYFNSGVLVFRNAEVNRLVPDVPAAVFSLFRARPELQFPDQDALNFLFGVPGLTGALSGKANFQMEYGRRLLLGETALRGKLLHYSWHKPWQKAFPAALPYWRNREEVQAILA
ncbi:MAG: hypothetical protein HDQ90_06180 [Desulfovibrio sp.]|nr:hypothetical protein [Desulfovibrio sp.]